MHLGITNLQQPLQTAGNGLIQQYQGYGPFVATFLANLLATFGDKGQLVIITLASQYDAKRVTVGAVAAFAIWNAVEVGIGKWIEGALPGGLLGLVTGGLFLLFGLWTLYSAVKSFRQSDDEPMLTSGGLEVGLTGRLLPDSVVDNVGAYGGVLTAFVFILFAEFGDKTQLLTINLAATFPHSPVSVYAGAITALALRTGVDAYIGEQVEDRLPTRWIELGAAAAFLAVGLGELGLLPEMIVWGVLGTLVVLAVGGIGWGVYQRRSSSSPS